MDTKKKVFHLNWQFVFNGDLYGEHRRQGGWENLENAAIAARQSGYTYLAFKCKIYYVGERNVERDKGIHWFLGTVSECGLTVKKKRTRKSIQDVPFHHIEGIMRHGIGEKV